MVMCTMYIKKLLMYVLKIRTLVKNLNISHTSGTTNPLYMHNSSDSGIYRAPRDSANPADIEGAKLQVGNPIQTRQIYLDK